MDRRDSRWERGGGPATAVTLFVFLLLVALALAACGDGPEADPATFPPAPSLNPTAVPLTATPSAATSPSATHTTAPTPRPLLTAIAQVFLPMLSGPPAPAATAVPPDTPTPLPSPTPTIDFTAVRAELQAGGQDLGFSKMGFHTGAGGNMTGIGRWMQRLDEAGVPFFLKSADNAGPLFEAQEIVRGSGAPHTLVYRTSGDAYDTPDYSLPAADAARQHWALHKAAFPPELDPGIVWIETINEVDKNRSAWLADFALVTAELAMADGFRWAAFGWSSGEPEEADWERPSMLAFLRLAAANPDRLAIALHEYSYLKEDIGHEYPYKVGRFQQLFDAVDRHGIPRPTVLITEWGWEYQNIPSRGEAMEDIAWAAELYAPYPQVRGAAIWYLGGYFGDIADQTQALIEPLTEFNLGTYYAIPLPPAQAPIEPEAHPPP